MPEISITGFEKRIREAVPDIKRGKAQRLALKIAKRLEQQSEEFDFYESLRILGVISDPTARDANRNIEDEGVAA